MTANASILVARREGVLRIPNAALRFRPDFARREATSSPQTPAPASAPAAAPSAVSPERILESLKAELKLTPDQESGIARILKDAQTEIRAAGKAGGAEEARAKAKELRAANRIKIRSLLTEAQKKKFDQMDQRPESSQAAAPTFRVWTPVPQGRPVPVEITTGISDGSYTEVTSGGLTEGQEVIVEQVGSSNSKPPSSQTPGPSMKGFR